MSNKNYIKKKNIHKDCWDLDYAFIKWLYERIPVYINDASKHVDLSYHLYTFEDKQYTQLELIQELYKEVKYCYDSNSILLEYMDHLNRLCDIWKLVLPAMWW